MKGLRPGGAAPASPTSRRPRAARAAIGPSRWLLAALAVALLLPASAAAREFEEVVEEAKAAKEAGDLERALALLEEAYALRPLPPLLHNKGRVLEELGRYREAYDAYKTVADDVNADLGLRTHERQLMAILQAKLGRSWVAPEVQPEDAEMFVDGAAPVVVDGEFSVLPGPRVVEVYRPDATATWILFEDFPAERRTRFAVNLRQPARDTGRITLAGLEPPLTALAINGYRSMIPAERLAVVRLRGGEYELTVERQGAPPKTMTVEVRAGKDLLLRRLLVPVAAKAPKVPPPAVEAKAPPVARKPTKPVGPTNWRKTAWPYVTAGAGLALVGVGSWLVVAADTDRDEVRNAARDDRNVVTGITFTEAEGLESDANTKSTMGAVLIGTGAAAVVGGTVWWLLGGDRGAAGFTPTPLLIGPDSVAFRATF